MRGVRYIHVTGEDAGNPLDAERLRRRFEKIRPDERRELVDDPDYQRYLREVENNPDYRPVEAYSYEAACHVGLAKKVKDGETELDKQLAAAPTFEDHQAHISQLLKGNPQLPAPAKQIEDVRTSKKVMEAEHRNASFDQISQLIAEDEEQDNLASHKLNSHGSHCEQCGIYSNIARKVKCPNPK